jgi:MFS family permease
VMLFLIGTFGFNFPIFVSTMAVRVFHANSGGYGLLSSIMALGTMSGALLGARREKPRFLYLIYGAAIFGAGFTLAALAPTYWLFAASLVVIGAAALTFTNTSNSLMQLSTDPEMRGRVMALPLAVVLGGTPIGAPIVGWVADTAGPRPALLVGAAAGFAAALAGAYARGWLSVRTVDRSRGRVSRARRADHHAPIGQESAEESATPKF